MVAAVLTSVAARKSEEGEDQRPLSCEACWSNEEHASGLWQKDPVEPKLVSCQCMGVLLQVYRFSLKVRESLKKGRNSLRVGGLQV